MGRPGPAWTIRSGGDPARVAHSRMRCVDPLTSSVTVLSMTSACRIDMLHLLDARAWHEQGEVRTEGLHGCERADARLALLQLQRADRGARGRAVALAGFEHSGHAPARGSAGLGPYARPQP